MHKGDRLMTELIKYYEFIKIVIVLVFHAIHFNYNVFGIISASQFKAFNTIFCLKLCFNYLVSVTAGGPRSPRGHM